MTRVILSITSGGSVFDARSPQASSIAELFQGTLVICSAIFLLVVVLVVLCIVRFRVRPGQEPVQDAGNMRLEIVWTLMPLAILIGLFLWTSRTMAVADPPVDRPPDITILARQWWWEVRYPSGAITANEIHIPTGKPLVVHLESPDVVHDFWVPALGRKIDVIPGRPVNVWLQADAPGVYLGTCAEYCGAQHAWMRLRVSAETPEDFAAWEQHELTVASAPTEAAAVRGARLFAGKTCIACHAINGLDDARVGPDLTHLAERMTLGAGVVSNTPQELARWLKDPQEIKPGCHMPNAQLTDGEVADLVAYFETLR